MELNLRGNRIIEVRKLHRLGALKRLDMSKSIE